MPTHCYITALPSDSTIHNLYNWKPRINPCWIPPAPHCSAPVIMLCERPTHESWSCYVVTAQRINGLCFCYYFVLPTWQRYTYLTDWRPATRIRSMNKLAPKSTALYVIFLGALCTTESRTTCMTSVYFFVYVTNGRITLNDEVERMWNEVAVACFKVAPQSLPGETQESE